MRTIAWLEKDGTPLGFTQENRPCRVGEEFNLRELVILRVESLRIELTRRCSETAQGLEQQDTTPSGGQSVEVVLSEPRAGESSERAGTTGP